MSTRAPRPSEFVLRNSSPEFLKRMQESHLRRFNYYVSQGNLTKYQDLVKYHYNNYLAYGGEF